MNSFFELHIDLNEYVTFNLENAVCNHGFFMMAPNVWDPSTKSFSRPLRLADSMSSVNVTISQPLHQNYLIVKVHDTKHLSSLDKDTILAQVKRMMRLSPKDEKDVQEFQKIHPEAKERGFGRIFRSPSLFEDAVKCFLLCFRSFHGSLKMAESLCDLQFDLSNGLIPGKSYNNMHSDKGLKRKRHAHASPKNKQILRNFPNAKELVCLDQDILQKHARTGYRTDQILEFAKKVESGVYQLREFEECISYKKLLQKVKIIRGFGDYSSANVLMCLGFYRNVPVDSETRRHLKEVHGRRDCSHRVIKETYAKYAPFQSLAFWCELVDYYESKLGKLSELPSSKYSIVTGSLMVTNNIQVKEDKRLLIQETTRRSSFVFCS